MYLRGEGLLYIIWESVRPFPYPKLQEEKPTISIDQIPENTGKEEREKILKRSQIITDTNDLIYLTNKAFTDKHKKKLDQYTKENSKACIAILSTINNKIITALKHKQTVKDYINYLKQSFEAYSLIYKANI